MSSETVAKTWRRVLAGGANAGDDEIIKRLEALEGWAKSRIRQCDEEIAQHDGTLRADGAFVVTYPEDSLMGRIDLGVRIRAGAEKQALEVVIRMLNGELEAP